ncbi:hypothetical protein B0H17DRAFT_912077, partial [Mycena rosella]
FRPAWGSLNELRLRLPKDTPFQALSGTLPPHIKSAVISHLNYNPKTYVSLKLSSNRPNTIYATHKVVGSLKDFRNLDFLVPTVLKIIVFHDDTQQCADAASYLNERLPSDLRASGLIRHYHGGMSKEYLTQVFDDFRTRTVHVRYSTQRRGHQLWVPFYKKHFLHAHNAASPGIGRSGIVAVVDYGLPQKKLTGLQRGGRCGRN